MSLIQCSECGKDISDTVKTCPNCGYKRKNESESYKYIVPIGIISGILFLFVVLSYGTFYGKPKELSIDVYNYGIEALNITDRYLDGAYDIKRAKDELEKIETRLDSIYSIKENINDSLLVTDILIIKSSMITGSNIEIKENRNNLAKTLNEKKR